ncbi:glycosyltransferase [Segetibacter sp. 3557_3]|uniref:glycosyltransferase family 2 protein n=1 Tax=Segetibacter sp. 3557_3 TaxID=2547429 RepID=UPI001058ED44|nr:glycosyltransferase [Segetibacter sp. 3557_3]TDH24647.1 glycosyltransferase [Segetibacter sp. 3557_3]
MFERIPVNPPIIPPVPIGINRPQWSVMIPVYNSLPYLSHTLKSVLSQADQVDNMQIEVVDDCSTDGDVEALVLALGQGRVRYFRQATNVGSLRNFETCLSRATGHWVHLLHGDDLVAPGFYKEIHALFVAHPETGAAFTSFEMIDIRGKVVIRPENLLLQKIGVVPDLLTRIARRQLIQPPAMVVKRDVYENLGSFFAVHYGEDWEMWARIASKYPVAYSPKRLAQYRIANPASISHQFLVSGKNIKDIRTVIEIIQNYLPDTSKRKLKAAALQYYSIYSLKLANALLSSDRRAALRQARGAFGIYKSFKTLYWLLRFYLMFIFRYKELEKLLRLSKS